jgi:3',5'-cyclic AMP phosphodiesterase CpdA
MPVYLMPGNHDERALRAAFPSHTYLGQEGFVQYSVPVGALQLIALDTVVPGASHGALCPQRLAWLATELERQRERPVILALHHPPFQTLIGHMDEIGLREGAAELEALVARHPQVQRLVCGHLHRSIQARFGGSLAMTAPSPAHQVCLDLAPDATSAWTLEPPGFAAPSPCAARWSATAWPAASGTAPTLSRCSRSDRLNPRPPTP